MLALRVDDNFLDLGGASASLTFENPIFDEERTARTFSFPFSIPATTRNKLLQLNRHRIDSRLNSTRQAGALYLDGQLIDVGEVTTKTRRNNGTSIYFQNNQIRFWESISNVKINEILETIDIPTVGGQAEWRFKVQIAPSTPYEIGIREQRFSYVSSGSDTAGDVADQLAFLINATFPGLADSVNATGDLIIVAPENDPVLLDFDQITDNLTLTNEKSRGQKRQDDFLSWADSITNDGDERLCLPMLENLQLYPNGRNYQSFNIVNPYANNEHQANVLERGEQWRYTYTPFVKVSYILQKILDRTKYTEIRGPLLAIPEFGELCLYSNYALDELFFDHYEEGPRYLNHHKQSIDLNEHVPDMSAREFLIALMDFFNLHIRIYGDYLYLLPRSEPIRQRPIDWSQKGTKIYNIEEQARKGFRLRFPKDPTDRYTPQLPHYISGAGERYLTMTIGSFPMNTDKLWAVANARIKVPVVKQLVRTDVMDTSAEAPTPRLLFYKGLQSNSSGDNYPYATTDTTDYLGNSLGTLALVWEGPEGLYEKHHKGSVDLLDKDTTSISCLLTPGDLARLTRWKNSRRRIYHSEGTIDGVVKSVKLKASSKESSRNVSRATVEIVLI